MQHSCKKIVLLLQASTIEISMTAKKICDILEHAGVRPTSIRILVYQAIYEQHDTFSLGDLESLLPTVDKSSLFRALQLFTAKHLIHSVDEGSKAVKYCVCHNHGQCNAAEEHCHFYCEQCHKTYCLNGEFSPRNNLPTGFQAWSINYVIKGLCAHCAVKKK